MEHAHCFFDLISPFSYHRGLRALRDRLDIQPVPVLFAGLLKHWGTKGPAEVPSNRPEYQAAARSELGVARA